MYTHKTIFGANPMPLLTIAQSSTEFIAASIRRGVRQTIKAIQNGDLEGFQKFDHCEATWTFDGSHVLVQIESDRGGRNMIAELKKLVTKEYGLAVQSTTSRSISFVCQVGDLAA